jgi:hypothetical protein
MGIKRNWYQFCSRLSNFFLMFGLAKFVADIRLPGNKMVSLILSQKKIFFFGLNWFRPDEHQTLIYRSRNLLLK